MTRCIKCHRPLKHASETGMGPVCAKRAQPIPTVERDLFGYSISEAVASANIRLAYQVEVAADLARWAVRDAYVAARRRLGVRV